jgi:hypothetical protein
MDDNPLDLLTKITYPQLWKSLCVTPIFFVTSAKQLHAVLGQSWIVFCVVTSEPFVDSFARSLVIFWVNPDC